MFDSTNLMIPERVVFCQFVLSSQVTFFNDDDRDFLTDSNSHKPLAMPIHSITGLKIYERKGIHFSYLCSEFFFKYHTCNNTIKFRNNHTEKSVLPYAYDCNICDMITILISFWHDLGSEFLIVIYFTHVVYHCSLGNHKLLLRLQKHRNRRYRVCFVNRYDPSSQKM